MRAFVDGGAGTTGLRIVERLRARADVELIELCDADRKQSNRRREALNECDVAFLCLPDDAAREAVKLAEGSRAVIIDASTAHRVDSRFAYGFPELSQAHRARIGESKLISVPGCHAGGFIALVYPLIAAGALPENARLTCHSVTGYSGGGKRMIAEYAEKSPLLEAPRQYALGQEHKHLKEMQKLTGLENAPIFCPIVADFYSGMLVTVPLFKDQLVSGANAESIRHIYESAYSGPVVNYVEGADEDGFLSALALTGRDDMQIYVYGNSERITLMARYDNLGKGASGAAIQAMNIAMGVNETEGLVLQGGALL